MYNIKAWRAARSSYAIIISELYLTMYLYRYIDKVFDIYFIQSIVNVKMDVSYFNFKSSKFEKC